MGRGIGGRSAAALGVLTAVAVVAPAAASAATKTVYAGPIDRPSARAFERATADPNAYFRKVVTVRRGDTVRWVINGFHTVTFVPRGSQPPALIAPDAANPVQGVTDPAGAPFWFNGQPRLIINPVAAAPTGQKTFAAGSLRNSGLPPEEGRPKPYTLRFNQTGRFGYLCVVHPGMDGEVRVVGRRTRVPTPATDRKEARREQSQLLKQSQRLTTGLGLEDLRSTIQAGNDNAAGAAIFKFFPARLRAAVGETVTLQMPRRSAEVHSFTFGPINGRDAYVDQIARNFISPQGGEGGPPTIVVDPRAGYPSEPPSAGIPDYDGANHGNGFYNSGILDSVSASPLPSSVKVRFTKAGTYQYLCVIHPFMRGTVQVE